MERLGDADGAVDAYQGRSPARDCRAGCGPGSGVGSLGGAMKRSPIAALTAMLAAALLVFGTAAPRWRTTSSRAVPRPGCQVTSLGEVGLEFSAKVRLPFASSCAAAEAPAPERQARGRRRRGDRRRSTGRCPTKCDRLPGRVVRQASDRGRDPVRVEARRRPRPQSAAATATGAAPAETRLGAAVKAAR